MLFFTGAFERPFGAHDWCLSVHYVTTNSSALGVRRKLFNRLHFCRAHLFVPLQGTIIYPTKREKENHLGMGRVSSQICYLHLPPTQFCRYIHRTFRVFFRCSYFEKIWSDNGATGYAEEGWRRAGTEIREIHQRVATISQKLRHWKLINQPTFGIAAVYFWCDFVILNGSFRSCNPVWVGKVADLSHEFQWPNAITWRI